MQMNLRRFQKNSKNLKNKKSREFKIIKRIYFKLILKQIQRFQEN